jgi:hypothetical protein
MAPGFLKPPQNLPGVFSAETYSRRGAGGKIANRLNGPCGARCPDLSKVV